MEAYGSRLGGRHCWAVAFVSLLLATVPVAATASSSMVEPGGVASASGEGGSTQAWLPKYRTHRDQNCRYYFGDLNWWEMLFHYLANNIESYEHGHTCVTINSLSDLP